MPVSTVTRTLQDAPGNQLAKSVGILGWGEESSLITCEVVLSFIAEYKSAIVYYFVVCQSFYYPISPFSSNELK